MKKLFIITAAAVATLAACSKVDVDQTPALIGFNVAKYLPQTKAYNSLLNEYANGAQVDQFTTNAWFHDGAEKYGDNGVQRFMEDQVIKPENTTDPSYWRPYQRNYFWPKTGYINFFSYAGHPVPTAKAEGSITYTEVAIDSLSNILVADGAFRYNQITTNDDTIYQRNSVEKGVPTLFRHILSKIRFDVIFDAKTKVANPDTKDKWTITITRAQVTVPKSGTIALTFTNPTSGTPAAPVRGTAKFNEDYDDWAIAADWADDNETKRIIRKAPGSGAAPAKNTILTAVGGTKSQLETTDGYNETGEPAVLIGDSAVIPYDLTDEVEFQMDYTIAYQYNNGTAISEDVTVSKALTDFVTSIDHWDMNHIYTYHVIIMPNGEIEFDPSVDKWVDEDETTYEVERVL